MKKKFIQSITLLSILLFSTQMLYSQYTAKTFELGGPPMTGANFTFIARDHITLKDGFSYKAEPGANFQAKIDRTLLFPPNNATYADANGNITTDPGQGGVVGNIPGKFNVSPTGAATYNIPIESPAGINGLQPNVSLAYKIPVQKSVSQIKKVSNNLTSLHKYNKNLKIVRNYEFNKETNRACIKQIYRKRKRVERCIRDAIKFVDV